MQVQEVEVPVPWGHIAVKVWGDEKNSPVLVVHGVMDNAGAMDRLLRLLPQDAFCFYAIDLPGHGRSSHWPPHATIHSIDQLFAYKAVVDYFGRVQYAILGHSWGGQLGLLFALIYPETVSKLIMLDTLFVYPISAGQFRHVLQDYHRQYFAAMEKFATRRPPAYTRDEALDRLMTQRRYGEISLPAAEAILARNGIAAPDGAGDKVMFSTDQRLKFFMSLCSDFRYVTDLLRKNPLECPLLVVLASESSLQAVYFKPVMKVFKGMANVQIREVEGNHDVHNNHPERIAPMISEFLLKENVVKQRRKQTRSKL